MAGLRISPACTTRNLRSALLSTGRFTAHTKALYLTDDSHARRGGIFLKEGSHAVMALENGAQADSINAAHTSPQTAVDVSAYQGTIDWKRVKNAGILPVESRAERRLRVVQAGLIRSPAIM